MTLPGPPAAALTPDARLIMAAGRDRMLQAQLQQRFQELAALTLETEQTRAVLRRHEGIALSAEALKAALEEKTAQLQRKTAEAIDLKKKNAALGAELTRLQTRMDRLLNSSSWKITAPIRKILQLLRKSR